VSEKSEKGLKPWLFKGVAVVIGICYLVAPLQQEITELMHHLSHSMDQGIGHHSFASHTHNFNDHDGLQNAQARASTNSAASHGHMESNEIGFHSHPHPPNSEPHKHEVIDFMSMAFSDSNPTHQDNDKIKVQSDLDKHIVVTNYTTCQAITIFKKIYFSNIQENTSKGIQLSIVPPPKPHC